MNARIRRNLTAPAAAAVSTLIVLAWLAAPTSPLQPTVRRTRPLHRQAMLPPPPPRRLHSSLSMPYFSFAQPLTPRS